MATFGRAESARIMGEFVYFHPDLVDFPHFSVCAVLDHRLVLCCGAMGRILPACALGMVIVGHGGVL